MALKVLKIIICVIFSQRALIVQEHDIRFLRLDIILRLLIPLFSDEESYKKRDCNQNKKHHNAVLHFLSYCGYLSFAQQPLIRYIPKCPFVLETISQNEGASFSALFLFTISGSHIYLHIRLSTETIICVTYMVSLYIRVLLFGQLFQHRFIDQHNRFLGKVFAQNLHTVVVWAERI